MKLHRRLQRELQTIQAMIRIYCLEHHSARRVDDSLCSDCSALLDYAAKRLSHCPYQHRKPTCGNCPIHCYRKNMRDKIRAVMRYSGPRMIKHHPVLAFLHLLDGMKKPPGLSTAFRSTSKQTTKE